MTAWATPPPDGDYRVGYPADPVLVALGEFGDGPGCYASAKAGRTTPGPARSPAPRARRRPSRPSLRRRAVPCPEPAPGSKQFAAGSRAAGQGLRELRGDVVGSGYEPHGRAKAERRGRSREIQAGDGGFPDPAHDRVAVDR